MYRLHALPHPNEAAQPRLEAPVSHPPPPKNVTAVYASSARTVTQPRLDAQLTRLEEVAAVQTLTAPVAQPTPDLPLARPSRSKKIAAVQTSAAPITRPPIPVKVAAVQQSATPVAQSRLDTPVARPSLGVPLTDTAVDTVIEPAAASSLRKDAGTRESASPAPPNRLTQSDYPVLPDSALRPLTRSSEPATTSRRSSTNTRYITHEGGIPFRIALRNRQSSGSRLQHTNPSQEVEEFSTPEDEVPAAPVELYPLIDLEDE